MMDRIRNAIIREDLDTTSNKDNLDSGDISKEWQVGRVWEEKKTKTKLLVFFKSKSSSNTGKLNRVVQNYPQKEIQI